jgi:hypothetical protein
LKGKQPRQGETKIYGARIRYLKVKTIVSGRVQSKNDFRESDLQYPNNMSFSLVHYDGKIFPKVYNGMDIQHQSYNSRDTMSIQSDFLRENDLRSDKGTITSHRFLIHPTSYMLFFTTGSSAGVWDLEKNVFHLLGAGSCASLLAPLMLAFRTAALALAAFSFFIQKM